MTEQNAWHSAATFRQKPPKSIIGKPPKTCAPEWDLPQYDMRRRGLFFTSVYHLACADGVTGNMIGGCAATRGEARHARDLFGGEREVTDDDAGPT